MNRGATYSPHRFSVGRPASASIGKRVVSVLASCSGQQVLGNRPVRGGVALLGPVARGDNAGGGTRTRTGIALRCLRPLRLPFRHSGDQCLPAHGSGCRGRELALNLPRPTRKSIAPAVLARPQKIPNLTQRPSRHHMSSTEGRNSDQIRLATRIAKGTRSGSNDGSAVPVAIVRRSHSSSIPAARAVPCRSQPPRHHRQQGRCIGVEAGGLLRFRGASDSRPPDEPLRGASPARKARRSRYHRVICCSIKAASGSAATSARNSFTAPAASAPLTASTRTGQVR